MELRGLGRSGWQVSAIGFGAWGIGGGLWRGSDDAASAEALSAALEAGCTFIDTALAYGDGHSERLIGRILRGWAGEVRVASKVPPLDEAWPARGPLAATFPAAHVRRSAAASADNLGRPVDLLQLHVWRDAWLAEQEWRDTERTVEQLIADGTIRAFGISINDHDPDSALEAVRRCDLLTAVQVIYNVFDPSPAERLFPACVARGVGVIARVPLDEGGLTGTIGPDTVFAADDFRSRYFTPDRRAELTRRVDALRPLLLREAGSLAEGALRFCLSHPAVSTVIPGMRSAGHARSNCALADGRPLSPGLLRDLAAHAWPRNWYPE